MTGKLWYYILWYALYVVYGDGEISQMAKKKLSLTITEAIIDQAKIKAIKEKTTVSKAVDAFLWAWISDRIDLRQLPSPEEEKNLIDKTK